MIKITMFSSQPYDQRFFEEAKGSAPIEFTYQEASLSAHTVALAKDRKSVV